MLNNKADVIEEYILNMLQQNQGKRVELKRTDLADEVSCAPSQISYVLSTRFTNARGYKVESRRGLGGYIRITIIDNEDDEKANFYERVINSIDEDTDCDEIKFFLNVLLQNRTISTREAELVMQTALTLYQKEYGQEITPEARTEILRSIFKTLSRIT